MTKNLVSILIPVYNVSKYLHDCFRSLEGQTYSNVEYIFVNDGSTDDSLQMIQEFAAKHPNAKVINQTNHGVAYTRNVLLANASGEFVYYFDPDDIMHPETIKYLISTMREKDVDLVSGYSKFCNEETQYEKIKWKKTNNIKMKYVDRDKLILFLTNEFFGSGCRAHSKLFKTEILSKLENYPNIYPTKFHLGEDFYMLTQYLQNCSSAYLINFKFLYYRMRKGSILHSKEFDARNLNLVDVDEKFYDVPHTKSELSAMNAKKAFHAIGVLWYMMKGKYRNKEDVTKMYRIMTKNIKYCLIPKYHQIYYFFLPIMVVFYLPYVLKVKRLSKKEN